MRLKYLLTVGAFASASIYGSNVNVLGESNVNTARLPGETAFSVTRTCGKGSKVKLDEKTLAFIQEDNVLGYTLKLSEEVDSTKVDDLEGVSGSDNNSSTAVEKEKEEADESSSSTKDSDTKKSPFSVQWTCKEISVKEMERRADTIIPGRIKTLVQQNSLTPVRPEMVDGWLIPKVNLSDGKDYSPGGSMSRFC